MIIFINGAFGVGKTSVARALCRRLPGSRLYDPEPAGLLLRFLALGRFPDGRVIDDFQDMSTWRRATIAGLRLSRRVKAHTIVPMAFSNLAYFQEVTEGVRAFESDIEKVCLVAPVEVVRQRLVNRGVAPGTKKGDWAHRRAAECCEAHRDPAFGQPVQTADINVEAVVDELGRRLPHLKLKPVEGGIS